MQYIVIVLQLHYASVLFIKLNQSASLQSLNLIAYFTHILYFWWRQINILNKSDIEYKNMN